MLFRKTWLATGVFLSLPALATIRCGEAGSILAPGGNFQVRRAGPGTDVRFPELVKTFEAAKKEFYANEKLPEEALLEATAKLWDAVGLKYEKVEIPEARNLKQAKHFALRLVSDPQKGGASLNHYVEAIHRIYGHSTLYDPYVLRQTKSTGLRRTRDVWKGDELDHYEKEVLISDAAARDVTIKDTLTHEAIHLHSAALRAQGIDSELSGFVMGRENSKISPDNTSPLYKENMWLEEAATAAHDAYQDILEVRNDVKALHVAWVQELNPDKRRALEAEVQAIFASPRFADVVLRTDDLKWVSFQLADVANRLGKSYGLGGQPVTVHPQTIDGQRWLRVESPETGLDYVFPLLGPELSKLPDSGLGFLPIVEQRMHRLETLGNDTRGLALAAQATGHGLKGNTTLSLPESARQLDTMVDALARARVLTNRAMPKVPEPPPQKPK